MTKKPEQRNEFPEQEDGEDPQQNAKLNPQTESSLFHRLPQEIRDCIWTQLFSSTRFTFGKTPASRIGRVNIKPAPNGLALLSTCRRAYLEIGDSWLRHVLFCFETIETMLDKLSALSVDTLSKLRYMRVRGDTLLLNYPEDEGYYPLVCVLKLLPGLQLDQLTILGGFVDHISYGSLNRLIKDGNGWKTLRYISYSSAMLGFRSAEHLLGFWEYQTNYWRKPQPAQWQKIMESRDGAASNPSVTVYRAKEPAQCGSILDPSRRAKFEQKAPLSPNLPEHVFLEDRELLAGDEQKKELMVVVRRGHDVEYEEMESSPLIESDIRRDLPGMEWKQIRARHIDNPIDGEDEGGDKDKAWPFNDRENEPAKADVYRDVDDYVWALGPWDPDL
ncbi:uncharacterized protein C8A04DRAFT_39262 [Dichotomopilus funicola]|uniref:Uncharacterized protein n=1 Tax=Dichotomopilus funicola TaxID=1934379 RepID=A0AAN6UXW7_9PEZI|nr:hypothetical protein C8A04DRAFT_39262 [Dichotomopilus funicola]